MADMPFDFGVPQPVQQAGSDLAAGWDNFLSDPRGRAALLSFGAQMMQPMGFGQTGAGHFGASLGAAGEGARNQEASDLKDREAESKDALRAAQGDSAISRAQAAEARAGAAGANSANMATRLEIARLTEEGKDTRARSMNQIRVSNMYQGYVKMQNEANRRASLTGSPAQPVKTQDEWLQLHPHLQGMVSSGREPVVGGAPSSNDPGGYSLPPSVAGVGGNPGPMPRGDSVPAAQRQVGEIYDTDRGPRRWTGTGWVKP